MVKLKDWHCELQRKKTKVSLNIGINTLHLQIVSIFVAIAQQ
jgi:hypothetical protein